MAVASEGDELTRRANEETLRRLISELEPALRQALTALYGPGRGREATLEAFNWAFERGYTGDGAGRRSALRVLFRTAQARSAHLPTPPVFDRPGIAHPWLDPVLAGTLSLLPMQDRLAVLLAAGAGWSDEEVARLTGGSRSGTQRRIKRSLRLLRVALRDEDLDDDEPDEGDHVGGDGERLAATLHERLSLIFGDLVPPVTAEEAMHPDLARAALVLPPELVHSSRRARALKTGGLAFAILAVLVGGIVVGLDATRPTTARGYETPGSQPAPGALFDSVVVIPNPPEVTGSRAGLGAVYELDAGSRRVLHSPASPGVAATSVPVTSGPWLADLEYQTANTYAGAGQVVVFRAGSTATRRLGLASSVYPGLGQGTFWLALQDVSLQGRPAPTCSLRLESADGRQLVAPTAFPCPWQILSAVKGGLLILSRTGITELWNPATGLTDPLPGFQAASVEAAGGTLVAQQWDHFCSVTCRVTLANPKTGMLTTIRIVPPKGVSLTSSVALSPNGRFLAVTALPIDEATTMDNEPIVGPTATSREITGQLVVIRVASGEVAMARPVTYRQPSLVEWSPDGSYVFLTRSPAAVAAVPVWSDSAPIETITIPKGVTSPADPGERFLIVGR